MGTGALLLVTLAACGALLSGCDAKAAAREGTTSAAEGQRTPARQRGEGVEVPGHWTGPQGKEALLRPRDELYDVNFADTNNGWAVGAEGLILHTADGGQHWKKQNAGTAQALLSIACPTATTCYIGGDDGHVLKTADGGVTWKTQSTPSDQPLLGLSFIDAEHGWAAGAGGTVLRTDNGGAEWKDGSIGRDINLNAVRLVTPTTGWVLGEFGMIFRSDDAGHTWTLQKAIGDPVEVKGLDTFFGGKTIFGSTLGSAPGELWGVGIEGTIVHGTNGGTVWEQIPTPVREPLFSIAFNHGVGVVVGSRGRVLVSRNGGQAWEVVPRERLQVNGWIRAVSVSESGTIVAVGGAGTILCSRDQGMTWQKVSA